MAPQSSAEKDLLKIIENPSTVAAAKAAQAKPAKKGLFGIFSSGSGASKTAKPITLKAILADKKLMLKILMLATFWVSIVFAVTFAREYFKLSALKNFDKTLVAVQKLPDVNPKAATAKKVATPEAEHSALEDLARNIFKPNSMQKKKEEEEKKDDLAVMLQDFKIVGISVARVPSQTYAMVENTKTKVTLFLRQGEMFNGMKLESITESKLIFKAGAREIELR